MIFVFVSSLVSDFSIGDGFECCLVERSAFDMRQPLGKPLSKIQRGKSCQKKKPRLKCKVAAGDNPVSCTDGERYRSDPWSIWELSAHRCLRSLFSPQSPFQQRMSLFVFPLLFPQDFLFTRGPIRFGYLSALCTVRIPTMHLRVTNNYTCNQV